ncbi:MAG: Ig-like domain-containing protein [Patescibacteria group bacterium]
MGTCTSHESVVYDPPGCSVGDPGGCDISTVCDGTVWTCNGCATRGYDSCVSGTCGAPCSCGPSGSCTWTCDSTCGTGTYPYCGTAIPNNDCGNSCGYESTSSVGTGCGTGSAPWCGSSLGTDICGLDCGNESSSDIGNCGTGSAPYCGSNIPDDPCGGDCGQEDDYRSANWTSPAAGASIGHDTTFTVSGSATDSNGTVAGVQSVEVYIDETLRTTLAVDAATGNFSTTMTANLATFAGVPFVGNHTIRLRAIPREGGDCAAWNIGTRTVTITNSTPVNTNFTIDSGGAGQCTSTPGAPNTCDGKNIVVDYDGNRNRQVSITATFADPDGIIAGRYTDIQYAFIVFNNTNMSGQVQDPGASVQYRVVYTDNANGTWSLTSTGTQNIALVNTVNSSAVNTVGTSSRSFSGGVLTLNFTINLASMTDCTDDFLTNAYMVASDFALTSDVDRRIGLGAFTTLSDANAAGALDVWGGKTVCGIGSLTSQGNYNVPFSYSARYSISSSCALEYTGDAGQTTLALSTVPSQQFRLPYYNLGSTANCNLTPIRGNTSGFYLTGTDFTNHGGANTTVVPSKNTATNFDTNHVTNGGFRNGQDNMIIKYVENTPSGGVPVIGNSTCGGSTCNSRNIITGFVAGYPPTTAQKIPIVLQFSDVNNAVSDPDTLYYSNIRTADMYFSQNNSFDANNNPAGTVHFGVRYQDNGNGTWSLVTSGTDARNLPGTPNGISIESPVSSSNQDTVGTSSRSLGSNILTLRFTLDFSTMAGNQAFLSNVYTGAIDLAGAALLASGNMQVGSGNFVLTDISGPITNAVDFWNGRDIAITGGTYRVDIAGDICSGDRTGLTSVGSVPMTITYSPNNAGSWETTGNNWSGTNMYQPYYYYNYAGNGNVGYTVTYAPLSTAADYFIVGLDLIRYGGTCELNVVNGAIENMSMPRGGYRPADSSHDDAAFAVKQISQVWSRSVDGDFFANSGVSSAIETSTCTGVDCYFTVRNASSTNGLPVANGAFDANLNSRYGSPNNWYAAAGGAPQRLPYLSHSIPGYTSLRGQFEGGTYTELTGDRTLTGINPQPGSVYFINGDLNIERDLSVAVDNFIVFIVSGDVTVSDNVTAFAGILIVPDGTLTFADSVPPQPNYDVTDISEQLTVQGSVAVGGATYINRSMGAGNNAAPSVIFQARPDMLEALKNADSGLSVGALYYQGEY